MAAGRVTALLRFRSLEAEPQADRHNLGRQIGFVVPTEEPQAAATMNGDAG